MIESCRLMPGLKTIPSLEVLQEDLAKFYFHRRAGVQLEADQTSHRTSGWIVIYRLCHQLAIDDMGQYVAARDDMDLIPVIDLDQILEIIAGAQTGNDPFITGLQHCHLPTHGEESAATLLIKLTRKGVLEVYICLVTLEHPLPDVRKFDTAILDAAVRRVEAILDFQFEIFRLTAFPDQESIGLKRFFGGGFADDLVIFGPPECGIAIPSIERLAIEDRVKPCVIIHDQRLDPRPATAATGRTPLLLRACRNCVQDDEDGGYCNELSHIFLRWFSAAK